MNTTHIAAILLALPAAAFAGREIPLPGGDFEDPQAWTISERVAMSSVSARSAPDSKVLHVRDADAKEGSSAQSRRFNLAGTGKYTLSFDTLPVSGSGLGVYVRLYDAAGKQISSDDSQRAAPSGNPGKWQPATLVFYAPPNAAAGDVWVHSYSHAKVEAALDNFRLSFEPMEAKSPWPGSYKIRPDEKERLTAADVVGPDGIVYPDWRYAGRPGGIPDVPVRVRLEEFGGAPDDGKDDSAALQAACDKLAGGGGGAVLIGPGVYHLDEVVYVTSDGVVIRGSGQDQTKLVFRYAVAPGTVRFFRVGDGETVTPDRWMEVHANPAGLRGITVSCDGKQIAAVSQAQHSGNMFSVRIPGWQVCAGAPGQRTLVAVASYEDGSAVQASIKVNAAAGTGAAAHVPQMIGALTFAGSSQPGPQLKLVGDGKRGDRKITLQDASTLRPGERIRLRAPATPRWNALVQNACKWGSYREYQFLIEAVDGNTVTLNQPLRLEFPVVDGSYVQEISPIRNCGVEGFTIEQTENLWINAVTFSEAWECWARGVTVKMAGRNPIYTLGAKWCEIRDCVFDDAHFKGGGGTAYAGFEVTCDSLMENVTTYNLRHAPLFQWAASGNVIRNSLFNGSDAQWHSGWTNENLFENCVVKSSSNNGAYGYGMWASPPEDDAHGPNGPRNVVYNCDISSPRAGLWMGGMNENWLILYNRFDVGSGPGVYAKTGSFDHIIRGNVFVLRDGNSPVLHLATPDCVGVEMIENTAVGGNGRIVSGAGAPASDERNTLRKDGDLRRPTPAVRSIFEWQRRTAERNAVAHSTGVER